MLINKLHIKKHILVKAKQHRPGWQCNRVSGNTYTKINAMVSDMITKMVKSHPTIGKTFKVE